MEINKMKRIGLFTLVLIQLVFSSFINSEELIQSLYFDSFKRLVKKYKISKCLIEENIPIDLQSKFPDIAIRTVDTSTMKLHIKDSIYGDYVTIVYPVEFMDGCARIKYLYCQVELIQGKIIYSNRARFYFTYKFNLRKRGYLFKKLDVDIFEY